MGELKHQIGPQLVSYVMARLSHTLRSHEKVREGGRWWEMVGDGGRWLACRTR